MKIKLFPFTSSSISSPCCGQKSISGSVKETLSTPSLLSINFAECDNSMFALTPLQRALKKFDRPLIHSASLSHTFAWFKANVSNAVFSNMVAPFVLCRVLGGSHFTPASGAATFFSAVTKVITATRAGLAASPRAFLIWWLYCLDASFGGAFS
ncbi:MAG: hypothetical protein LBI35_00825 [Burkholderiales bacterium]|nr:hypothetical protein [Burkholderiales bacterium]